MAIKISKTGLSSSKKTNIRISTTGPNLKNDGSVIGYLGQKVAIGTAGIGEGIYDFTVGSMYQLLGDKEYAKQLHENDIVGAWNKRLDKAFNPNKAVKVAGDISMGVGQALPSLAVGIATGGASTAAQIAGGIALGTGYAGRGITDAVKQTNELGLKENIYGIATGALEGVTDATLGGVQKAGKAVWTTTRHGASKIARNTLVKGVLSSAASEATEEFLQEYADTALQRLTGVNNNAEYSVKNALYSAFIGGVTGGMLSGATGAMNVAANYTRGVDIMKRGNSQTLINTANLVRQKHIGNSKNYSNITSEALRALTASVDAYNGLDNKTGNKAAVLLGEIKVELAAFENAAGIDAIKTQMMNSGSAALAAEASRRRGKTYTVSDIRNNTDGITEELALDSFVNGVFEDSEIDTKKAMRDEAIASERIPYVNEAQNWDGQTAAGYRDPKSGRYVFIEPSIEDGKWRLGISRTAIYDENDLLIKDGLAGDEIKKALAGLADGRMVMTSRGIVPKHQTGVVTQTGDGSEKKVYAKNKKGRKAKKHDRRSESDAKKADKREPKNPSIETRYSLPKSKVEDSQVSKSERTRGYSDQEADSARAIVRDFDIMSRDKRLAIVEMIRSAEAAGASTAFKKHAAAMIGYWRNGLHIIADSETLEKGFYTAYSDGSRLIVVNPKKGAVNTILTHELAHDVWRGAGDKTRKALYDLAVDGLSQKDIDAVRERYIKGYAERGLKLEEGVLEEEVFTNLLSETLKADDILSRFDISPDKTSGLMRVVKSTVRMAKTFFGRDKLIYRKCETITTALARVMGAQLINTTNATERATRRALEDTTPTFTNAEKAQHVRDAAEMWGYTHDYKKASFILPSGNMLNFGNGNGFGVVNHGKIKEIYSGLSEEMAKSSFISEGNIRIIERSPGIEISADVEPTISQYNAIGRFIAYCRSRDKRRFYVDFMRNDTYVGTLSYDGSLSASEIEYDIEDFFKSGELRKDTYYSLDFDENAFFANALENGGVISHEEAEDIRRGSLQVAAEQDPSKKKKKKKRHDYSIDMLKAEVKDLKKDNRDLHKTNDKLAHSVSKTQQTNAELRDKNRKLTQKVNNSKRAQKIYDKQLAHEKDRLEREKNNELKRASVEIRRIVQNVEFFKNSVTHRKGSAGALESAKLFEDIGIKAFAETLAKNFSKYGIFHERSRTAANLVLPYYTPDHPLFNENAMGEFFSGAKQAGNDSNVFGGYNETIRADLETLANGQGQLSYSEVKLLDEIIGHFAHLYKTYDKVIIDGKRVSATEEAYRGYSDAVIARKVISNNGGKEGLRRFFKSVKEAYLYTVITPEEVLKDIERHVDNGVLSKLYRQVRLGEAEAGRIKATLLWDISKWLSEHDKFYKSLEKERFDFGIGSDKLKITTAQAIGLYETSKREHARQRLFSEDEGVRIRDAEGVVHYVKINKKMIEDLYKSFNDEDLKYIELLEATMESCKKYKIDTDMEVMGFSNAIDGHYYPITTDANYFAKDITDIRQSFGIETVKNKGFNQNTVQGARAWLVIESSQKVLERHVHGISQYAGLFIPLQSFGKVYGAKFDPMTGGKPVRVDADGNTKVSVVKSESLRGYLNNTLWADNGLDNYLSKLFADIQHITPEKLNSVDKFISFIRSGYVNSIFGMNPKIILTQLAAYPASFRLIDADCLAKAFALNPLSKKSAEEMDKHSRITLARRFEGTTAAEGLIGQVSEFGRKLSAGIELTDRGTILALFSACQLQIAKDGGAEVGSEANLKAAGELLDNLLLDTQTTSLQSDRSVLMRSRSEFAKIITMFKTESMKSFSQMYSAISTYHDHKKLSTVDKSYEKMFESDKKRIGRNIGAYLISAAWVGALSIAFRKLYNIGKEDDEPLVNEIIKESIGVAFDMIPIVSDVAAFMLDGYDVDSIPLAVINDSLNMFRSIGTVFDVSASKADKLYYLRQSVYTIGKMVGLPIQNTYKLARTLTTIVSRPAGYVIDNTFDKNPSYKSDLDRAVSAGNERLSEAIMRLWMSDRMTGKASDAAVKELTKIYVSDGIAPRTIPSTLTKKERIVFMEAYSGAETAQVGLMGSKAYKELGDREKAQAVKACYDAYYVKGQKACGIETTVSGERMVAAAEVLDPSTLYALIGFAKTLDGEQKKAKIVRYLISLGIKPVMRAKYLAALGYAVE